MKVLPSGMEQEKHSLNSSAPYELLKIYIETDDGPVVQHFCLSQTLEWNGLTWSKVAFNLSGLGDKSGGEKTRPRLILPNPEGVYSYYIQKGYLDNARVTQYLVHPENLDSNESLTNQFYVSRIVEVNRQMISCQLNYLSDGNNFMLPPRRFTQPEFNQVRL